MARGSDATRGTFKRAWRGTSAFLAIHVLVVNVGYDTFLTPRAFPNIDAKLAMIREMICHLNHLH